MSLRGSLYGQFRDLIGAEAANCVIKVCDKRAHMSAKAFGVAIDYSTIAYHGIYSDTCYYILFHLDSNRILCDNLRANPSMAPNVIELIEKEELLDEKKEFDSRSKVRIEEKFSTTMFCPKCGSNQTSWDVKQTRTSDEAPTVLSRCAKCGNKW